MSGSSLIATGSPAAGSPLELTLTIIAEIWDENLAQLIQLGSEYDPHPPFRTGSPKTLPPELVAGFESAARELTEARRLAAGRAAARWRS